MSYTNHLYHIVFGTKGRLPMISQDIRPRFHEYLGGIVRGLGGIAIAIGGIDDHVHLLIKLKPTINFADFMRDLKSSSSKWAKENGVRKFAWQRRYGSFTVSESQVERVRKYVLEQERHHSRVNFKSEFEALLSSHNITIDDFVWQD